MPAAFTAHLRQDASPTHAPEEGPAEPSHAPRLPHSELPIGLGSAAATAAPVAVTSGQGSVKVPAQTAVGASRSAAEGAHNAPTSSDPPEPEALSWFLCTDEIVKPVSWDAVTKCKAYILLYMRTQ